MYRSSDQNGGLYKAYGLPGKTCCFQKILNNFVFFAESQQKTDWPGAGTENSQFAGGLMDFR
jgi:hypothetical protein